MELNKNTTSKCQSLDYTENLELRSPTTEDWHRWRTILMARYKEVPARVFIDEMEVDGLRVTSIKMLRDHYRQWGINDKNRRYVHNPGRRRNSVAQQIVATAAYRSSGHQSPVERMERHVCAAKLRSPIRMPKEMQFLQRTMKSALDWQQDLGTSEMDDAFWLHSQLRMMQIAIHRASACSSRSTRRLAKLSIRLHERFQHACTPLTVLVAINGISSLNVDRQASTGTMAGMTRSFLLRMAAEVLPESHPVLLLLQLLLDRKRSSETLAAVYRLGCDMIGQRFGTHSSEVSTFQIDLVMAAYQANSSANFDKHVGYCDNDDDAIKTARDLGSATSLYHLYSLADLRYTQQRYARSATLAKSFLSIDRMRRGRAPDEDVSMVWRLLSCSQHQLQDFTGEEISLRNALEVAKSLRPYYDSEPGELSADLLRVIHDLYSLYRSRGNAEQCKDLRYRYPRAFEE